MPKVRSIDETLDKIISDRSSICRFGDSEFLYIVDNLSLPYQRFDSRLKNRLIQILTSNKENILIGLPVGYYSLDNLNLRSKLTWRSQIVWVYPRLKRYIDLNRYYYNASMTRLYIGYIKKDHCIAWFDKLKSIWKSREIVVIEGEKSRLGVGNDLFSGAAKIERIIAPMHNAFSRYDEILDYSRKISKNKLILISLGPTAKVLAYDLAELGYQALDIGNADIEYEWFLRKATDKERIPHKYTSEAKGGRAVEDIIDKGYESQIVAKIL